MISTTQLRAIMPALSEDHAAEFVSPLNDAMIAFGIDQSAQRIAMFLAQCAHESLEFHNLRELWGPTPDQARYEGAARLGNTEAGDGFRYRGRGLIQITGRANYRDCSIALFADERLLADPELLEQPPAAAQSAAWFWQAHGLNLLADAGRFDAVTRVINGGTNGIESRLIYYARAKTALGLAAALTG